MRAEKKVSQRLPKKRKSGSPSKSKDSEILELTSESWANLGTTVAHAKGKIFFVKGGIPEERLEVSITKENSKIGWATVSKVLKASPERISVDCKSFPDCGGCSYRHISYEEELRVKSRLLADTFLRIGSFSNQDLAEIKILSGPPEKYRNTAQIKLEKVGSQIIAGFYKENTNILVPFPEEGCRILPSEMNDWIQRKVTDRKNSPKGLEWKLRMDGEEVTEYEEDSVRIGPLLSEKFTWQIPSGGFTQVNRFLLEPWLEAIRSWVVNPKETILELYCGSGLISLSVAPKAKEVFGFEISKSSVDTARHNASTAGLGNVTFEAMDLEKKEPDRNIAKRASTWIVNPPRAGLSKKVLDYICSTRPKSLIYSSCNHTTLARDAKVLKETGFRLEQVILVDFFPRTQHFEVLTLFSS
ncbi:tRNA (uracil-5-)-methyltransferase [Leptospira perolatii]|uniref:tRNA (Uracil-5-)-methyltransferase n=1 Tax=Leptospira perolatii TaxID=2023191 RepID=A0A2M9ZR30_9LEPT|nr:methyltransferase domain-containing protein [Leptospira perolatii]PJZ71008.1 tRNA (uracil-5-)-methyltransferase [Leptospira perolatii]PJZ74540.1 tRNA (uracil-5-)-methyltransferase [Leptospira perolatii]